MLKALDSDGKIFCLLDGLPVSGAYFCPLCRGKLCFKNGKILRPHFAHLRVGNCHYAWENESEEHLSLKALIYRNLRPFHQVEIEKYLDDCEQVADLLVNNRLALEVQCSTLAIERLRERTLAYQKEGLHVRWLLGKSLWLGRKLSQLQRQFLLYSRSIGFHLWELNLEKESIRLKYLIHEDYFGNVFYQTREFSLKADLLKILRLPYLDQFVEPMTLEMPKNLLVKIQKALRRRNPYWLKEQENAYLRGDNILIKKTEDFYPFLHPPQSEIGFCQIDQDYLKDADKFFSYYKNIKNKQVQTLYPPRFYDKMEVRNF